jgi:quercetin dioxygenase-like cupin family protein
MPVDLFEPFTNPITGETFRCLSSSEDAYVTEWLVEPKGYVPFRHIHVNQDEIFHVQQGEIRVVISGQQDIGVAGQTVRVPRGVGHVAYNNKPELLHCIVEYRPGLDQYQAMQCFGGLTLDHDLDRRGIVNIPKMMYFMRRMNALAIVRPTFVPAPLFGLFMFTFYIVGSIAGWDQLYRKYTV